jgi:hypothetical protein
MLKQWWRVVAVLAGLPPLIGLAMIILLFSGLASPDVMHSGAAISSGLVVAGFLILVPPGLYIVHRERYDEHQTSLQKAVEGALGLPSGGSEVGNPGKPDGQADDRELPPPSAGGVG